MIKHPIYFDYNATTPMDPGVLDAMLPWFVDNFGNAASRTHAYGWDASYAVDTGRAELSRLLGVDEKTLTFTSGATEAVNLAIKGIFQSYRHKGNRIITLKSEHKAVLDTCKHLSREGADVVCLDVDQEGLVDLKQLQEVITDQTVMVSIMWGNNETGVIQPMQEIGNICKEANVVFFSDATQAVGKIEIDPISAGVHLLALSGHKFYGPKGIGALWVSNIKPAIKLQAQIHGGGHQGGFRSGTLNVPGIVGLGKAADLAFQNIETENTRHLEFREFFEKGLKHLRSDVQIAAEKAPRLSHVSNIRIPGIKSANWFTKLGKQFAFSTGSACSSALAEPSHVLESMGYNQLEAEEAVRISWGRFTKIDELESLLEAIQTRLI